MSDDIKARLVKYNGHGLAAEAADHIEALEAENARLREALESIYRWTVTSEDPEHICGWVEVEARAALSQDNPQDNS